MGDEDIVGEPADHDSTTRIVRSSDIHEIGGRGRLGVSLAELIAQRGALRVSVVADLGSLLAWRLREAHRAERAHGNLSTSAVLVHPSSGSAIGITGELEHAPPSAERPRAAFQRDVMAVGAILAASLLGEEVTTQEHVSRAIDAAPARAAGLLKVAFDAWTGRVASADELCDRLDAWAAAFGERLDRSSAVA